MKKTAILSIILVIFSCTNRAEFPEPLFQDLKYYTLNTVKPGFLIKKELKEKKVIVLTYPKHVVQSYSLIKFITSLLAKNGSTSVFIPNIPSNFNSGLEDSIRTSNPLLAYKEFIDIYNFFINNNINILDSIKKTSDYLLILNPYSKSDSSVLDISSTYNKDEVINVEMVGVLENEYLFSIIPKIPTEKHFSSVYKKDDTNTILIFNGLVKNFTKVHPLILYNLENYMSAPEDFIYKNKSLLKKARVNKMNMYLSEIIKQDFKFYGELNNE